MATKNTNHDKSQKKSDYQPKQQTATVINQKKKQYGKSPKQLRS